MLNREKHQLIMGQILKDIYTDTSISSYLGFKGGTCAYFFYGLPRFSIDLDFDLLADERDIQKKVFQKLQKFLKKYGKIKNEYIKRYTIFLLLSYGDADRNIKIEINTRKPVMNIRDFYEPKEYLGILMMVAKKDYLFSTKLTALTSRKETAMRDVYDIYYFAKNNWDINRELIEATTGKKTKKHLTDCIAVIKTIKNNQILHGVGELLSEKEKNWVKNNLKTEVIFLLKNYLSALK